MTFKSHLLSLFVVFGIATMSLQAQKNKKPNILVIWGDDIGQSNISAYTYWITSIGIL